MASNLLTLAEMFQVSLYVEIHSPHLCLGGVLLIVKVRVVENKKTLQ